MNDSPDPEAIMSFFRWLNGGADPDIMPTQQSVAEIAAFWGWTMPGPADDVVPYEHRCWKDDVKRVHTRVDGSECLAALCGDCCLELRLESPIVATIVGDESRFWQKVKFTDTCWEWIGARNDRGYGQIRTRDGIEYAHRLSYTIFTCSIPDGWTIDHLCKNPPCIRPDHLDCVTRGENTLRGDGPTAQRARQTECVHGHTLDDAYVRREGWRQCRDCKRVRDREYRQRKAASAA